MRKFSSVYNAPHRRSIVTTAPLMIWLLKFCLQVLVVEHTRRVVAQVKQIKSRKAQGDGGMVREVLATTPAKHLSGRGYHV
jgi:hypothetical protein